MSRFSKSLDLEWAAVVRSPAGRRALMRWAAANDAFAGLRSLDDVRRCVHDPARRDVVLGALAGLAPTDDVAARTLLQSMVGGLLRLANGATGHDQEDAFEDMDSLAWERIHTYPVGRPGPVGGNILLDVKKRYRAHRDSIERPSAYVDVDPELTDGINGPEAEVIAKQLLADFISAQRAGIITKAGLDAVVRVRLLGETTNEIGGELNVNGRVVRQWRLRAESRLRRLALAG